MGIDLMACDLDAGYYYIAYGKKSLAEALQSAESLREISPEVSIAVRTNVVVQNEGIFNLVLPLRLPPSIRGAYHLKVFNLSLSPFSKTFYVDADTYFVKDCGHLFELLDSYDLCAAVDPHEPEIVIGTATLNSGIMLYRKSKALMRMFYYWSSNYDKCPEWDEIKAKHPGKKPNDQPYLAYAIRNHLDVSVNVLPTGYNYRITFKGFFCRGDIYILHGHLDKDEFVSKYRALVKNRPYWQVKSNGIMEKD